MKRLYPLGIAILLIASVACTKPVAPQDTGASGAQESSHAAGEVSGDSSGGVMLYNAFTASEVDAESNAINPSKAFKTTDPIYIAAVVHGEAGAVKVQAEWSLVGGPVLGSAEKSAAVHTAEVVTLAPIPAQTLVNGSYMATVYLNGKPQWELFFQVTD